MTLTLLMLVIGCTLLLAAIRSLRAHRLQERYALLYLLLGLPFFGLAAWPDAIGRLAVLLGIEYQTLLLITVTTFFLFMTFKLLSIVSRQERKIASLAQVVAILEEKQRRAAARDGEGAGAAEPRMRLEKPGHGEDAPLKRGA